MNENDVPSAEFAPNGPPNVDASIRQAVAALSLRSGQRDERGRFASGNAAAAVAGSHSPAMQDALTPAKREIERRTMSDFGLDDRSPQVILDGLDLYADILVKRKALGETINAAGVTTSGTRAKRLLTPYLAMADRELKARAALLELVHVERRTKTVGGGQSLEAALAAEPEAR